MKELIHTTARKWIYTLCLVCTLAPCLPAQTLICGQVNDAASRQPLEAATVVLSFGDPSAPLAYTLTGADGSFTIRAEEGVQPRDSGDLADSLFVTVSLLGYCTQSLPVRVEEKMVFNLAMELFHLKEVEVRPGRVWGRQDTINFEVDGFLGVQDRSIQDVLKKMPGIHIDEDGKIAYNGKEISRFYIEGLDLSNGKYAQLTRNLQAGAVEKVQVLENHQPIRLLRQKIKTEDVALNLRLKPDFRDRWMGGLTGGAGASPFQWSGAADALQIGRKSQAAYVYKGNNTGNDVTEELASLTRNGAGEEKPEAIEGFLEPPSFDAPLKKKRLLFNDVHSVALNRLYKTGETTRLRWNADYTHDCRRQQRGSETIHYRKADSLSINQQSDTRLRHDRANLSLHIEDNADHRFFTNTSELSGDWQTALTRVQTGQQPMQRGQQPAQTAQPPTQTQRLQTPREPQPIQTAWQTGSTPADGDGDGDGNGNNDGKTLTPSGTQQIRQQIRTPYLRIGNALHGLWNREDYTFEVRSRLSYHDQADKLRIEPTQTSGIAEYALPYRSFYTANSFALLRKKGKITGRYETGFTAETGPAGNRYSLSFAPHYQWSGSRWSAFVSLPLVWTKVSHASGSRFAPNPSLTLIWKPNYAWRFSAYATYTESYGSLANLYATPYRTDYRHTLIPAGRLPIRCQQLYSVYGQYKHTVGEVFATWNLTHTREKNNLTEEEDFDEDQQITVKRPIAHRSEGWTIQGGLSKGFYDWGLKTTLTGLFHSGRGAGWSEESLLPFRNRRLEIAPKISWTPWSFTEISYEAMFRREASTIGQSVGGNPTRLTPLWAIVQQGQIRFEFSPFGISLAADHYHNDVNRDKAIDAWLADVTANWKNGNWELSLSATNLFDKKEYRYTEYTALQHYTSWIRIRPREFLLTASYRF